MKIILDFDGDSEQFKRAMDAIDDLFYLNDSIFYHMDYGKGDEYAVHHTEFGDIKITVKK